jgi:hypothetical protein
VNSKYIPIYIQQNATLNSLFISGNCCTYFGWYFHPSSRAHTTVSTASGICHTVTAICHYRGRVGTGLSVLWVACATHSTLKPDRRREKQNTQYGMLAAIRWEQSTSSWQCACGSCFFWSLHSIWTLPITHRIFGYIFIVSLSFVQVAGTCGYSEGLSGSINAGNSLTSCKIYWLASQEGLCSME